MALSPQLAHFSFLPADLASGDRKSATFDTTQVQVTRIASLADPLFEVAYARLWEQFGASHELESREVLGRRMAWQPTAPRAGLAMRYDLLVVQSGGAFVAVRDHTAIADAHGAVVHLSHLLIDPAWRRGGLAGWLRALPIQTARACLTAAGFSIAAPITLCAEMEYPDGLDPARDIRLSAYERAEFQKVDPTVIHYHQPDFRPFTEIDASAPQPLPFQLILRRVGREPETQIAAAEVRTIVERFYHMYAQEFRAQDMASVWNQLAAYPPAAAQLALLPPTTSPPC